MYGQIHCTCTLEKVVKIWVKIRPKMRQKAGGKVRNDIETPQKHRKTVLNVYVFFTRSLRSFTIQKHRVLLYFTHFPLNQLSWAEMR